MKKTQCFILVNATTTHNENKSKLGASEQCGIVVQAHTISWNVATFLQIHSQKAVYKRSTHYLATLFIHAEHVQ